MHTTTQQIITPSLPSVPTRKPRVARSPYPFAHKSVAPVTSGRKAYSQLKSMLSSFKLTKTVKTASQGSAAVVATRGDEKHAPSGQLALGHANDTRVQSRETAPTHVSSGQLALGYANTQPEPQQAAVCTDEYFGWAQVAKTSARFLSTLLDCPETLPSADPTEVHPDLARFVAFSLYRSSLPLCVHQYALHLIWRVKSINPDFKPKHAHGTYLTALMLATKLSHDDADYRIRDWVKIGQHIFDASQLRDNEWRMCERLGWELLVHPMDLVKLAWTIEVEYGELDEGPPLSSAGSAHIEPEVGLSGMFAGSVTSSLSSLSTSSSCSLDSPWSGWGQNTPCDSAVSTPLSGAPFCVSSSPSPFTSA